MNSELRDVASDPRMMIQKKTLMTTMNPSLSRAEDVNMWLAQTSSDETTYCLSDT